MGTMTQRFRTPPMLIKLAEVAGGVATVPRKVQFLRLGKFRVDANDPKSEVDVTRAMLSSFVKNFNEKVRGIDIAIDYKHASDDIAAAWIKSVELAENGSELWCEVDWTPKGEKVVSEKEFRYISPDFHLNYKSNESGKTFGPTLLGAGLTNRPVIKGMDPVVELTEGKGTGMNLEQALAKIAELEKKIADMAKEDKTEADSAALADTKKQLADANAKLAEADAASKSAAAEKALAEKKTKFDKLLSEGKVVEAQREPYIKGDSDKFLELAGTVKLSEKGGAGDIDPAVVVSNSEEAQKEVLKLAEKAVADKSVKSLSEGINKVLNANPELRKKYETR